jgi:UDP-glucose 4-epimerase
MKKILVTGCSGYIGQHLCKVLEKEYVVGMDRIFVPVMAEKFVMQDITSGFDHYDHYDTVIHLAALVNVGQSMIAPMEYYKTNVTGTLKVLENISFDNFIFASTGVAENPCSPYALSKANVEALIRQYCIMNNKDYTIFRFYNVTGSAGYGPTNWDGLFYNLMKARETGEFNLYGNDYDTIDGTAERDYVHVLEVCNAIKMAVQRPSNLLVENLGTGTGHTVQQIVDKFKQVNGCDFKVNHLPRRYGDMAKSVLKNVSPYMQKSFTIEEMLKVPK